METVLIGKLLKRWARETDLPCRYGEEEFAVLLPEASLEGARIACERLRRMVAEHRFEHEDPALNVTISIGIAQDDKTTDGVHFQVKPALEPAGFLLLGKAEVPIGETRELFDCLDRKAKLCGKL